MSRLRRKDLAKWLLHHGFEHVHRSSASGHDHFEHTKTGVVITVTAHGKAELSKKHVGSLIRELERAGFDRKWLRQELL